MEASAECGYCRDTRALGASDLHSARAAHLRDLRALKANVEMLYEMIEHGSVNCPKQARVILREIEARDAKVLAKQENAMGLVTGRVVEPARHPERLMPVREEGPRA